MGKGCTLYSGIGDRFKINVIINAGKYSEILIYHVIPYGKHLIQNGFFFMTIIPNTMTYSKGIPGQKNIEWTSHGLASQKPPPQHF